MTLAASYSSIVWTARVTAIFSLIVAVGLTASSLRQLTALPLDDPQYVELKNQLTAESEDAELQQRLRAFDVELRRAYFQQQAFRRRGAYLLMGGITSTLLLTHWATTIRRRLPTPKPQLASLDTELQQNHLGQVASVALIATLTILVLWSQRSFSSIPQVMHPTEVEDASASSRPDADVTVSIPSPTPVLPPAKEEIATSEIPAAEQLARNWPRFRGPTGGGESAFSDVPEHWDVASGDGILWKTAIELPGVSSPIVWGGLVFLTGATVDRREVFCVDAASGKLLWKRAVAATADEPADIKVERATGFAASTPATDGQRVYAIFASGDLAAFDLQGNLLWSHAFGKLANPYGHASSLVTYRDLLIVQLDQGTSTDDKSQLLALRGPTGETVWQTSRPVAASWSTPLVVEYQGQPRVITSSEPWVIAYAVDDGRELWRAECLQGDIGTSPVYGDGVVYVANDNAVAAAIRDGGEGDVTESRIVWTAEFALPDICSPLLTDDLVLLVAAYGGLVSYDRQTGGDEPIWEEDLGTTLMASPCRVGDRVYLIGEDGKGWVVKTSKSGMERIAENDLGEPCFSSPAFQPGRIFIRGEQHLFCIGKP